MEGELQKLQDMFDMGFIMQEEYDRRRAEITGEPIGSGGSSSSAVSDSGTNTNSVSDPWGQFSNPHSFDNTTDNTDPFGISDNAQVNSYNSYNQPISDPYSIPASTYDTSNSYTSDPYSIPASTYDTSNSHISDPYAIPASTYDTSNSHISNPYAIPASTYDTSNSDTYAIPASTYDTSNLDTYAIPESTYDTSNSHAFQAATYELEPPINDPFSTFGTTDTLPISNNSANVHDNLSSSVIPPQPLVNNTPISSPPKATSTSSEQPKTAETKEYVIYGKNPSGVVLYHTTRESTWQSPLVTGDLNLEAILKNLSINGAFYLQDIFDKKRVINSKTDPVPKGQYYLKEKSTYIHRHGYNTSITESRLSDTCAYSAETLASMSNYFYDPYGQRYNDGPSFHVPSIAYNCFQPREVIHNNNEFGDLISTRNLVIQVIHEDTLHLFPQDTTMGTIRKELNVSAGYLTYKGEKCFSNDGDVVANTNGVYRLVTPYTTVERADVRFKVMDHVCKNLAPKVTEYKSVQKCRIRPIEPQNLFDEKTPKSAEEINKMLAKYSGKQTKTPFLKIHFTERTRHLQKVNKSIGNIFERVKNNLCIISGKPSGGQLIHEDHNDETLVNLHRALVEHDLWDDFLSEYTPPEPRPEYVDIDQLSALEEIPLTRDGDVYYSNPSNPHRTKFTYVDPQYFVPNSTLFDSLAPWVKNRLNEQLNEV